MSGFLKQPKSEASTVHAMKRKIANIVCFCNRHASKKSRNMPLLLVFLLCFSCQNPPIPAYTTQEHSSIDSFLATYSQQEDSLQTWLQRYTDRHHPLGIMLAYKNLGIHFRETARFNEAIEAHRHELDLANQLNDTLEMVQALNNIGTSFRRMGILDEASTYHYQALFIYRKGLIT